MDWIINKRINKELDPKKRYKRKRDTERTKYCTKCKLVWEICLTGKLLFYDHLPTYGLIRKVCNKCQNKRANTYKEEKRVNDNV